MRTTEQYRQAIHELMPQGLTIPSSAEDSEIGELLEWVGEALLTAENAANDTLDDSFPSSAGNFLSDWERVLNLPRPGIVDQTASERRDVVLAWLNISQFSNKAFFVSIAAVMGFDIIVTDRADDPSLSAFEWQVNMSADLPVTYFMTGQGRVGEPLVDAGSVDALESLIRFFSPAHTTVSFNYLSNLNTISGDNLTTISNNNIIV
jgi:uncharacterized protein YmfQ (DUF2313 family)